LLGLPGWQNQILVVLKSIIASVGAAGIPEAGLVTMTAGFRRRGIAQGYIGICEVDWFLDRCRDRCEQMADVNVSCMLDGKNALAPEDPRRFRSG